MKAYIEKDDMICENLEQIDLNIFDNYNLRKNPFQIDDLVFGLSCMVTFAVVVLED